MKAILFAAIALSLLIFGCCGQTVRAPPPGSLGGSDDGLPEDANASGADDIVTPPEDDDAETDQQPTGDGTILDVGDTTGADDDDGSADTTTPASQSDCASMTPTCGDCVAKQGCGWCKSRNGCFSGNENGPAGIVTCEDVNWAFSEQACAAPVGGDDCSSQTNCADCLSGSACKWCQEGTKCVDASSSETCGAGGWRTIIYMCYAGQ